MASIPSEIEAAVANRAVLSGKLLVMLTPVAHDAVEATLGNISVAFSGQEVAVSLADSSAEAVDGLNRRYPNLHLLIESLRPRMPADGCLPLLILQRV